LNKADERNTTLGQDFCNKIGFDVDDMKIMMWVTLRCNIRKEIMVRAGDSLSSRMANSEFSSTRYDFSHFNQNLTCVDGKFRTFPNQNPILKSTPKFF
jgi:hypothetical protein